MSIVFSLLLLPFAHAGHHLRQIQGTVVAGYGDAYKLTPIASVDKPNKPVVNLQVKCQLIDPDRQVWNQATLSYADANKLPVVVVVIDDESGGTLCVRNAATLD